MRDNTITVNKDNHSIDIYTNKIFLYADEYINSVLDGNTDSKVINDHFPDMLFYIHDYISSDIDTKDIKQLDNIFNAYIKLNTRYSYIPTIEMFSFLVGISISCINDWIMGNTRNIVSNEYNQTAKRWKETCKSFVVNRLTNQYGTNANLIFIAKSVHGMAELAPIQVKASSALLAAEELPQLDTIDSTGNIAQ